MVAVADWFTLAADTQHAESDEAVVEVESVAVPGAGDSVGVVGWFNVELSGGDVVVDGGAVGVGDVEASVGVEGEVEVVEVDDAVVEPAEPGEVVESGSSAVGVFVDVVGVEGSGVVAAGELAGAVAEGEPASLSF